MDHCLVACLACCSPWGRKESDTTCQLNNNLQDGEAPWGTQPCPLGWSRGSGHSHLDFPGQSRNLEPPAPPV